jgi:hypothetical protein
MSEIRLYDSRGYPLDDPNGERNETIRNMSRYGVVFTISYTQPYELATYFRAYESASGRMEQYYATYTTSGNGALLREFREAVVHAAEETHDLEIERSKSGENVLGNLDTDDPGQIGTDSQRSRARALLAGGERLRFGVDSYEKAFKLIDQLAGARPGMELAVTEGESTHAGPMSTYDLIVEKGPYVGLEPLGETESLMNPEPDDQGDAPVSDETMGTLVDVGYGVAAAVLLVVVYAAVASLLYSPLGLITLPYTADVPLNHDISANISEERAVMISGSTPADSLIVQFEDANASDTINVPENGSVSYTNESVPANATAVRVQYRGILTLTVARNDELGPAPGASVMNDAEVSPSSTTSPRNTSATPTSTTLPRNTSATPSSTTSPRNTSATPSSTTLPRNTSATPSSTTSPRNTSATPTSTATTTTDG